MSAQLHALAEALQVLTDGRSGDDIVAGVCARADALLAQLPDSYQQPLLSRESLSEAQVGIRHSALTLHELAHAQDRILWPTSAHC